MEKRRKSGEAQSQPRQSDLTENSTQTGAGNIIDDSQKPSVGMEFESEEAAKNLYDAYASKFGFSTQVGQYSRTNPVGPIVSWEFTCSREVFKRKNVESCNAMLRVDRKKDSNKWIVTKFVEDHNHSTADSDTVHSLRPRRHFAGATKSTHETAGGQTDIRISTEGNNVIRDPNSTIRIPSPVETNPTRQK